MKIVIDAMGGDHAPDAIVEGAILATEKLSAEYEIILVGQEDVVRTSLRKYGYQGSRITVAPASDVITNEEAPVRAVRRKKDSSLVVGLNMVKHGEGDVFLSAGSTGAVLAGSLMILGRIRGIDRPTLATVYPVIGGEPSFLTDAGANAECKPRNLLEFAMMGSIYMEKVLGRKFPTVGLLNNGTEEEKGTSLTKKAHHLLKKSDLNFIGNVEARDLQNSVCDVIVTDGFTGNAVLKLTEGLGLTVLRELKKLFVSAPRSRISALLIGDKLKGLKSVMDYREYGGAPILGVKGAVLKMHGSSDETAVLQTIRKAIPYVEEDVVDIIARSVKAGSITKILAEAEEEERAVEEAEQADLAARREAAGLGQAAATAPEVEAQTVEEAPEAEPAGVPLTAESAENAEETPSEEAAE